MSNKKWIYYAAAVFAFLAYCIGEATDMLILAMPIVLPLGLWVIWNLNPDKPDGW